MSQVTPRTGRPRKSRKSGGNAHEAALLATRRREPLISGVTDGETFHLIVEPQAGAKKPAAPTPESRGLFEGLETLAGATEGPAVIQRVELAALELPYRFALACTWQESDGD